MVFSLFVRCPSGMPWMCTQRIPPPPAPHFACLPEYPIDSTSAPTVHHLGCIPPLRLPGLDENIHSLSQQTFLEHQSGPPVPLPGAGLTRQVRPYSEKLTVQQKGYGSRCLFIGGRRGGWVLFFPSSELPLRTKLPRILQVNFR